MSFFVTENVTWDGSKKFSVSRMNMFKVCKVQLREQFYSTITKSGTYDACNGNHAVNNEKCLFLRFLGPKMTNNSEKRVFL